MIFQQEPCQGWIGFGNECGNLFGWKQRWHSFSAMHGRDNDGLNEDDHVVDKINRKNIRAPIKMLAAMC